MATHRYREIFSLPVSGAGCDWADIRTQGVDLVLSVEGVEGQAGGRKEDNSLLIKFASFTAFRFRDEMHSRGYLSASYDCICEILDSAWVAEMIAIRPKGPSYFFALRHFVVMLSNVGYFEILASGIEHPPGDVIK